MKIQLSADEYKNISEWLDYSGASAKQIYEHIGISPFALSAILVANEPIEDTLIDKIAKFLNLTKEKLLGYDRTFSFEEQWTNENLLIDKYRNSPIIGDLIKKYERLNCLIKSEYQKEEIYYNNNFDYAYDRNTCFQYMEQASELRKQILSLIMKKEG